MRADAETFHLEASLEAFENDRLVFETTKTSAIPRHRM